ncbi:ABC transporter permease subunit [Micromonospora sp. WMMD1102]|uniref:ABC transporter permease subunit n=1 Tax=Micromonospora sp. WMMD1102 TaxID=3016105 RepID=UPI0024151083|nr:ABC transporter permease subunit [Micromonospora sp. WMMD1102]MDG4784564.1 ABC transporter permease subunit [Micromonospora sp. WMMD1102]
MRITFARVVRSEWTKLCSLRSTWLTLGTVLLLAVGLAGAIGYGVRRSVQSGEPPPDPAGTVAVAFLPMDFLMLVVGVFGVIQITGEYGSGAIRATLTAVPRRWPVLAAKAVALAGATVPVLAVSCLGAFLACQVGLGSSASASLADPGVPRAIAGAAGSAVLMGLLGLGIGAMLRHTAGAITALVVLLMVAPVLVGPVLPGEREEEVLKFVPALAGQAMYALDAEAAPFEMLSPGAAAATLVGWAALLLLGGIAVLGRRDG